MIGLCTEEKLKFDYTLLYSRDYIDPHFRGIFMPAYGNFLQKRGKVITENIFEI